MVEGRLTANLKFKISDLRFKIGEFLMAVDGELVIWLTATQVLAILNLKS
jgi:hypothetical protein